MLPQDVPPALQVLWGAGAGPCTSGHIITGGISCNVNALVESRPDTGNNSWLASCVSGGSGPAHACSGANFPTVGYEQSSGTNPSTAPCTKGLVIGGGCSCTAAGILAAHAVGNAWECTCVSGTAHAYAVCAKLSQVPQAANGTDGSTSTATCPAGKLVGGGCSTTSGSGPIINSLPDAGSNSWSCSFGVGNKGKAHAYCATL